LNDCFTQVLEMERRLGLLKLGRALTEMLARLERLRKSGLKKLARSDEDAPARREFSVRLHRRDHDLGRPPDRGPAGDAERRQ
jgi:hypothetical protein